ncbi:MAG TPA: hypothetical protein VLC71_06000 [Thermomonas sp.]|nr:hypothetical protein [Thermomonas sp.]
MSATKAERAAQSECRSLTTEELMERRKECRRVAKEKLGKLRAICRELRRRRSEQWSG